MGKPSLNYRSVQIQLQTSGLVILGAIKQRPVSQVSVAPLFQEKEKHY